MTSFYITTPIYYVNDIPHIGHAYTTLLADVLARYHRLLGVPTHFVTGTDEHGQKVWEAATQQGITPQEQVDHTVVRYRQAWKKLEISHDDFIRTTEARHTRVVKQVLEDLWDRGEIYKGEYEGWYSVSEERFYTEKDLVDGLSPEGKPVERVVEDNYFFRMSHYQDWLINYIQDNPNFIQPDFRRNETLGFLKKPLKDLCISRPKSRMPWGIDLPFDTDHVCYVWFDALVNYISAIGHTEDEESFQRWWPPAYHLIGKDILTTHSVYWTTMLKAAGLPQPRCIFAHGWWLIGGTKMSKSDGNVIDPLGMADKYGVDALRYFLMSDMSLGQDATFTEEAFVRRYNTDLANDLGNLTSRVIKMIERNFGGKLPDAGEEGPEETQLREHTLAVVASMKEHLEGMSLDRGIARALEAVRQTNRYFDQAAPWALAKSGDLAALGRVLYNSAECLRIVSGLLYPVIPGKMTELRMAMGLSDAAPKLGDLSRWGLLEPGTSMGIGPSLFPRIRPTESTENPSGDTKSRATKKAGPGSSKATAEASGLIGIEDVSRVNLRTAVVREACAVEGADRLLKLKVDIGAEVRQIVAGIAAHYGPEEIVGRTVIVVTNLKPATIRGVESQGMLLAAKKGKKLRVITVDGDANPGWSVG